MMHPWHRIHSQGASSDVTETFLNNLIDGIDETLQPFQGRRVNRMPYTTIAAQVTVLYIDIGAHSPSDGG